MIVLNPCAVIPLVLLHKACGCPVEQAYWMRRWAPEFYTCKRCNTMLHRNNVEAKVYFAVP